MRFPFNQGFFADMKAIQFPYKPIFFRVNRSPLQNIFGGRITSAVDRGVIDCSSDLWCILVKLPFIIFIKVVEVNGFWAEDEVIEGGYADILFHIIYLTV